MPVKVTKLTLEAVTQEQFKFLVQSRFDAVEQQLKQMGLALDSVQRVVEFQNNQATIIVNGKAQIQYTWVQVSANQFER